MDEIDEVARLAVELPEVEETTKWGRRTWTVGGKGFVWERPFSKADIKRMKPSDPPEGVIIAVTTGDLDEKEAVLAEGRDGVFTIEHFDGYPSVLINLAEADDATVRELVVDAWLAAAPTALADRHADRLIGQDPPDQGEQEHP